MTPLLTFLRSLEEWHIVAVATLALLFAGFSYVSRPRQTPAAQRMLASLWSAFVALVALSTLGFVLFAWSSDKFGALTLFPPVFVVLAFFASVGMVTLSLEDRDLSRPVFVILSFVISLVMAGLVCGAIAFKHSFGA